MDLSAAGAGGAPSSSPGKTKPALSSSTKKKEKKEELPLTARARKATKQLFKELHHVRHSTMVMKKRVEATKCIVEGVMAELNLAADGVQKRLEANKVMTAMTKPTRGGAGLAAPIKTKSQPPGVRRPNAHERKVLSDDFFAEQQRDPDEDELEEAIALTAERKQQAQEILRSKTGESQKPIVEALQALQASAVQSVKELVLHQAILHRHVNDLKEMIDNLYNHEKIRDDLFDPVKTNEKIERSVLYQKMNPLQPLPLDLQDKDPAATAGRNSYGTTGHEATFLAAEREDTGRADCNKAMKAVRAAQQEHALRKSQLQVAVLNQRKAILAARRAAKTGNFGSSDARNTDPSSGGAKHRNPEDPKSE